MSRASGRLARAGMPGRTVAIQPVRSLDARINITPLIDVVLVLLIVFMVMTPLVERELAVELTAEKRAQRASQVAPRQILVSLGGAGELRINAEPVNTAQYTSQLRALLQGRTAEARVVFVMAADGVKYLDLVSAIDRARQAGALQVGIATDAAQ